MTTAYNEAENHPWLQYRDYTARLKLPVAIKRQWTSLTSWLADLQSYREAVVELRWLSDRELDDIGIPRWQIPEIAWRSVVDRRSADRGRGHAPGSVPG